MNNDFQPIQYEDTLHFQFQEKRRQIAERINTAIAQNQDWEGKQLDKDILFPGNKIYSSETCVFVELRVNVFTTERNSKRGELPIGVSQSKGSPKYIAECRSVVSKGKKYLGAFDTPEEAHAVWLAFKLEQAYILAAEQTDPRVAKALIDRYKNYKVENPL